jgi:hypothetical protein
MREGERGCRCAPGYSRKSVRLLTLRSSARIWAELHEQEFRRLGGIPRVIVLDNLKEGVLRPDWYDPTLNPLYRDALAQYGVTALPCRVGDPDRKGKVEAGVGHAQRTPLKGLHFEARHAAGTEQKTRRPLVARVLAALRASRVNEVLSCRHVVERTDDLRRAIDRLEVNPTFLADRLGLENYKFVSDCAKMKNEYWSEKCRSRTRRCSSRSSVTRSTAGSATAARAR